MSIISKTNFNRTCRINDKHHVDSHYKWTSRNTNYRYLIAENQRICFFYNPSVATSTLRNIIHDSFHTYKTKYLYDKSSDEFDINNYTVCAIVRNPYHRFISSFIKKSSCKTVDCFKKEIQKIVLIKRNKIDIHYTLQSELIDNTIHPIIFKLEKINEINDYLTRNNFTETFNTIKKNVTKSPSHKKTLITFLKNNLKVRLLLYNYYKSDFDLFNYDKNDI